MCSEHEIEDLDDIVVALEVAQRGVTTQDFDYDTGQLALPLVKLLVGLCASVSVRYERYNALGDVTSGIVYESTIDIFGNLLFVPMRGKLLPRRLGLGTICGVLGTAEENGPWLP